MKRPSVEKLRRAPWLRGAFVWMLAVLVLTGASTYSHGTRYDLPVNNLASAGTAASADSPEALTDDCCERRYAPRGEPAPLRTGAVDPPTSLHWEPTGTHSAASPPEEREPRALTLAELSVSRT